MIVLDAVSLWATGVAGWLAESRCVKREVSRPQVADGYGRGSCEGQLLDADMGPQRRLRSTSGLPSRHGTAMWLGCYGDAMRRRWEGVVVRGARGLTFTENGPFSIRLYYGQRSAPRWHETETIVGHASSGRGRV